MTIDEMVAGMKTLEVLAKKEDGKMAAKEASEQHGQNDYTPSPETVAMLKERAKFVQLETIRLIEIAKVGHYSSVFSAAEIFSALYYDVMATAAAASRNGPSATAS